MPRKPLPSIRALDLMQSSYASTPLQSTPFLTISALGISASLAWHWRSQVLEQQLRPVFCGLSWVWRPSRLRQGTLIGGDVAGTGGSPELGGQAAQESSDQLAGCVTGGDMVCLPSACLSHSPGPAQVPECRPSAGKYLLCIASKSDDWAPVATKKT